MVISVEVEWNPDKRSIVDLKVSQQFKGRFLGKRVYFIDRWMAYDVTDLTRQKAVDGICVVDFRTHSGLDGWYAANRGM